MTSSMLSTSPITMDDVSSGFNIGTNISLDARFNEMIGFTTGEVEALLAHYHAAGQLPLTPTDIMEVLHAWYDGYRFAKTAKSAMFNSDMVLYFLLHAISEQDIPDYVIDPNVRIDYQKLRHLVLPNKRLNPSTHCTAEFASIFQGTTGKAQYAPG